MFLKTVMLLKNIFQQIKNSSDTFLCCFKSNYSDLNSNDMEVMYQLILFVYRYFFARSFTKLLDCSHTGIILGLTPSSEDCGPKPKGQCQGLGTVLLLGTVRIEKVTSVLKREILKSIDLQHLIFYHFELSQGKSIRFQDGSKSIAYRS